MTEFPGNRMYNQESKKKRGPLSLYPTKKEYTENNFGGEETNTSTLSGIRIQRNTHKYSSQVVQFPAFFYL